MNKLIYINGMGPNYKGQNIYEFIFSEERKSLMTKIFNLMDENCQKVIKYVIFDNLSMKEIAQKMNYTFTF